MGGSRHHRSHRGGIFSKCSVHKHHHHSHLDIHCRRHRGRKRLFWKVYLHGVFLLLAVGLTVALMASLLRKQNPYAHFHMGVAKHISYHYPDIELEKEGLRSELEMLKEHFDFGASVYDLEGRLIATNTDPPLPALDAEESADLLEHPGRPERGRGCLAAPLMQNGEPVAYVSMSAHLSETGLIRGLAVFAGVLSVLALASIPLVRAIISPLERLTETARAFGVGDLSARTGIRRDDEAGQLARTFDEMADRIEERIRNEKELLANVSHELRTPLARIRFALELAAEGEAEEAQVYLGEIGTDLNELEGIVEDVLTTARLDLAEGGNGQAAPPLRKVRVPAQELLVSAIGRFRSAYPERALECELPEELPEIEVDPILLRRVIENLLSNARKYSDVEEAIVLAARVQDAHLCIEVHDRGIGVAPEDLSELFKPFFRTDRSRARQAGGVGLGLTLCKRVVEAHGGSICAESTPGEGTTLRITLPLPA